MTPLPPKQGLKLPHLLPHLRPPRQVMTPLPPKQGLKHTETINGRCVLISL